MEQLYGGYTLELNSDSFPLSTDSMALSGFVKLPKNASVLDLGSGCGTLGLLLCAKDPHCTVTGVELSESDHRCALKNIAVNGLGDRLKSLCADLRSIPEMLPAGSFAVCVSNPPYFTGGFKSATYAQARHTDRCSTEELFAVAGRALKYGGDFFLVHKPENLAQLCHEACKNKLQPKTLCLLRHQTGGSVTLVLLQCRKGGKVGLTIQEQALYHTDGTPTAYFKQLYHL